MICQLVFYYMMTAAGIAVIMYRGAPATKPSEWLCLALLAFAWPATVIYANLPKDKP